MSENAPLLANENGGPSVTKKEIGVFSLVVLSFFWVSGGMYGNEEMMQHSTPAHALFGLLATPLLYSLPLVMVTAELASAMPWEGGTVAWVQEAFGTRIGAHNAYWTWIAGTIDASIYPRFAAAYLLAQINGHGLELQGIFASIIIIGVTAIKLFGIKPLITMSTFVLFIVMVPSVLFLACALPSINPAVVINMDPPETKFDNLLVWLLWLYGGVLNMGSVAKEVDTPGKTYIIAAAVLLSLDMIFVNFLPLLLSLSIDPDRSNYKSGHFAVLGEKVAGKWLSVMLTFGAQISQIGLYASISLASDQFLSQFIHTHWDISSNPTVRRVFGPFATFLLDSERTGAPRYVILINASIHFSLAWFPIVDILRYSQTVVSLCMATLMITFIYLKQERPDIKRPFTFPGDLLGAVLISCPCLTLTALNLFLACLDDVRVFGLPSRIVFLACVVAFGFLMQGVYILVTHYVGTGGVDERKRMVVD